jgi:hypothetical protein
MAHAAGSFKRVPAHRVEKFEIDLLFFEGLHFPNLLAFHFLIQSKHK